MSCKATYICFKVGISNFEALCNGLKLDGGFTGLGKPVFTAQKPEIVRISMPSTELGFKTLKADYYKHIYHNVIQYSHKIFDIKKFALQNNYGRKFLKILVSCS